MPQARASSSYPSSFREGRQVEGARGEELGIGVGHPGRRLGEVAVGGVPIRRDEQVGDRPPGSLAAGSPTAMDDL